MMTPDELADMVCRATSSKREAKVYIREAILMERERCAEIALRHGVHGNEWRLCAASIAAEIRSGE